MAKQGGRYARNKGHSFERKVAEAFRRIFPGSARKLEYHESDCTGVDLRGTGPFRIQCKRNVKYAPIGKIEEIQENGIKALVTQGDRKKPVICLYLDDFLEILSDIGVAYEGSETSGNIQKDEM